MHNVSALTLMQLAYIVGCTFPPSLGAWTSRRGLAWRAWSGLPSSFMHDVDEQLQLASSGNQFSKIGHI